MGEKYMIRWILYFLMIFTPLFTVMFSGIPLDRPVNPAYISGFITASGVFLGFLTAALINKSETLEYNLKFEIYVDLALFAGVVVSIFGSALRSDPTVSDLTVIMMSLMADIATAISIVNRLRFHNNE